MRYCDFPAKKPVLGFVATHGAKGSGVNLEKNAKSPII
jgi:hypothetical protein